jgi:hypothetical protein
MSKLNENGIAVKWQAPVRIRVGNGPAETIRGPEEGLRYLTYRWPAVSGGYFHEARLKCLRALQNELPCQAARDAFVSAAEEARMLA